MERLATALGRTRFATIESMDPAELARLPLADRLQAMEVLWDSLCHDDPTALSPDWHEAVLQDRRSQLATAPLSSLDEVESRLRPAMQRL
jgi:hypothetical protein